MQNMTRGDLPGFHFMHFSINILSEKIKIVEWIYSFFCASHKMLCLKSKHAKVGILESAPRFSPIIVSSEHFLSFLSEQFPGNLVTERGALRMYSSMSGLSVMKMITKI